jgi:4-alpha-glucanotransferase
LSLELSAAGHGSGWTDWPEPYRDIESAAVEAFADAHADSVDFHIWLQWLAYRQLAEVAEAAREAGMRIGLYADLAVGDAPDGSATWSEPGLYARGMKIGAPPDFFSANGQDWNLAPLSPAAMAAANFAPYRRRCATPARCVSITRWRCASFSGCRRTALPPREPMSSIPWSGCSRPFRKYRGHAARS